MPWWRRTRKAYSVCALSLTTRRTCSDADVFTTPAAIVEDDFFRLELVQLQVVCGRPRYNIAKFGGAC